MTPSPRTASAFRRLDHLAGEAAWGSKGAQEELAQRSLALPAYGSLLGAAESPEVLKELLSLWPLVYAAMLAHGAPGPLRPFTIWSLVLPLAWHIKNSDRRSFGFAGAPGCGKTTLVATLRTVLEAIDPGSRVLNVSLDDFYLSKAERAARGIEFRAQPGSHNIEAAVELLAAVREGREAVTVPRFNHAADETSPSETFAGPVSTLIFEGWFVGMDQFGYAPISEALDELILLEVPISLARERRLGREARIRQATEGAAGFSEERMNTFWKEILEPGVSRWVRPIRKKADIVITLNRAGDALRVDRKP